MRCQVFLFAIICTACAGGRTVIPIKVQYGNPVATAEINGQQVRLMVDSGGLALGLRAEAVARLNIERTADKTSTTDIQGKVKETSVLSVSSLLVGNTEFSDLEAFEWQIPPPLANRTPMLDGILGREFLNRFLAVYDYRAETITLYDDTSIWPSDCTGVELQVFEHPERIVSTKAIVDAGTVNAIWDTGATHSFIKAHVANERKLPLVPDENNNQFYNSERFILGNIEFGPLDFAALPFTDPANIDIYVGRNFFMHNVVCINMVERKIRVQRNL